MEIKMVSCNPGRSWDGKPTVYEEWLKERSLFTNKEVNRLLDRAEKAESEIRRLKNGEFTEEEFQNLCHNRSVQEGACRFKQGCEEYTKKLFGRNLWDHKEGAD